MAERETEAADVLQAVIGPEPSLEDRVPSRNSEVPRISAQELKARLDRGETIVIVDTRSAAEYEFKHIAGAISVPSLAVETPLDETPLDQEIVLYCT